MGPSPHGVDAAREAATRMNAYPDGGSFKLRRALSERLDVAPGEVILGAGSNEIIHLAVHAMCRPGVDQVLAHRYAFITYRLAALSHGVEFVEAEVRSDLSCDPDALIAAMGPRTKLVFLANPNNPTGAYVPTADFERILAALPEQALLVVDEAYHEYAMAAAGEADYPSSQRYLGPSMPRVLTLRTFSKIHGLAGLRVGYGVGHARVIEVLDRVRQPFNVNSVAQAAALAAMDDAEHLRLSCEATRAGLDALRAGAERLGLRAYPSLGNFILVDVGRDAAEVHGALLRRGVIVRPMMAWGLPQHVRISVGTPEDIARVTGALADVLGPGSHS